MSNGHPIDGIDGIYSTLNNDSQTDQAAPSRLGLPHLALHPNVMGLLNGANEDEEESTEDEMEWEEVDLRAATTTNGASGLPTRDVTITLSENVDKPKKRTADPLHLQLRLSAHKLHTIALLASFSLRNRWINDPLLHARLISLTPLHLQTAFSQIHVKLVPDQSRRSRLFTTAIFKLTEWWFNRFRVVEGKGMRSRTYLEVERERLLLEKKKQQKAKDIKGKGRASKDEDDKEEEDYPSSDRLRSAKSLMKHAILHSGSRDTSAILFTALCRALDVPARLVVSLQSVPWSAKSEKMKWSDLDDLRAEVNSVDAVSDPSAPAPASTSTPTTGGKGKGKVTATVEKGKGKEKVVKLRRGRSHDRRPRPAHPTPNDENSPPLEGYPPVVWTEVYSRPEGKWIPVDCVRYLVDKRKLFEPPEGSRVNKMGYVVAWEEDGYAKDVTVRYARQFGAKTVKSRASSRRGQSEWWELMMALLTRPYRLNRDDVEDNEFRTLQYWEGMPTSVGGFKDHPIYALERHLRTDEVIHPRQEIGKFRGEPVFSRTDVQRVRTAETWLREGRVIRMGQQPLTRVKARASTINKKREWEMMKERGAARGTIDGAEGDGEASEMLTQGLYALWQTELYVPNPVIDGKIPKNDFGNINLFVKSMLPYGATHLPYQGIAKIAKTLGIDFAPAVTGFEFRRGHANPIITGIVVASENEDVVLSAYWESAQAENEAEAAKRYDRVIRRWTRLVQGLRLRKRLQEEYGNSETIVQPPPDTQTTSAPGGGGGFLTEYDGVIEHFNLPKPRIFQQIQEDDDDPSIIHDEQVEEGDPQQLEDTWAPALMEQEVPLNGVPINSSVNANAPPKTLRQRAAEHYARQSETSQPLNSSSPAAMPTPPPPQLSRKRKATRRVRDSIPSSEDSASEFENLDGRSLKRTRSSQKRPSQPRTQRQLRPRVHK